MNRPSKTFNITQGGSRWTKRYFQVECNHQAIFWVNTSKASLFKSSEITLQTQNPDGPVVATAILKGTSGSSHVFVGDPNTTGKVYIDVLGTGSFLSHKEYKFTHQGRQFLWRRTHDKALGASTLGDGCFKLIDAKKESQILAAYIPNRQWFNSTDVGKIDWYAGDLPPDLELASMAGIFAIEEALRRRSRNSAAAGAGASAGGGGGC